MKTVTIGLALVLCASTAGAQGRKHDGFRQLRPDQGEKAQGNRKMLERRFRERTEQVVKQKLNLNDDQVTRLRSVNANIGGQRNDLLKQERSLRSDLREEMAKGSGADQSRVTQLMNQAHDLQGRRFALQQEEQKQLSGFLTPVQVAQYVGFQAQIRQRMRAMTGGANGDQAEPNP
jgi:Spy/CpxP family protein refolding chaperone